MRKKFFFLLLIYLGVSMAGCARQNPQNTRPKIRYGEDTCDECRMIISEQRFAAVFRTDDGQARRFDDLGCLRDYLRKHDETPAQIWVSDYHTGVWLKADSAFFVRSPEVATPMAHGIVAFSSREEANSFSASHQGVELKTAQLFNFGEPSQKP